MEIAQEQQLKDMIAAGKTNKEIKDFFITTYNYRVPAWKLTYLRGKDKAKPSASPRLKRPYNKKGISPSLEGDIDIKELVTLLQQIDTGYKSVLKHIRAELIKSRAQVHDMMRGAGIEVSE